MKRRIAIVSAVSVMVWCAILGLDRWVEVTQLPVTLSETSVEVRDRDGKLLRAYPIETGIMRLAVRPEWVDPGFVAMLIRYEDKRFHDHPGVDLLALVRAVGQAVWNRRAVSGGSTLTMQVARLLENGSTGRWNGKLRQMRVALALERRLSKAQILTLYLTHAPYGGNLEGIRAATLAWFGKEPGRLTAAQAGLLVALPQSPERRRPDRFPRVAADARNRVLARMETYGVLDQAEHAAAVREAMPAKMRRFPMFAPHLADRLRQHNPEAQRVDLTIDVAVQAQVEQVARSAAHHAGRRVSTAILVADHQTGEILASVGSPDYVDRRRQGFVDMTQAVRSPGSTLKPLIYGLAFDQGLVHPETLIHDGPVDFEGYAPRNFDGVFRGDLRVREALQLSLNIPVVKLTHELGAPRIMASLRRAGADPHLPGGAPGLAIALGGVGVSLQDLVQLYAGISRGGQGPGLWVDQLARPVTRGRLMSPEAAWHLGDILRDLSPPPGGRAGVLAYKTGTSYGHRDTWAIGWDGRHVIGVWMGRADGTPVPGAFGAELAAPVLFEAFSRLKPDLEPFAPPPPATLILGSAELPQPLRRFRSRNAAFSDADDEGPKLVFPPDGAILAVGETGLVLKVQGGQTPFLVMADGVPVMTNQRSHAFEVPTSGQGFSTLVVVDRAGRTDRVRVQIR